MPGNPGVVGSQSTDVQASDRVGPRERSVWQLNLLLKDGVSADSRGFR